MAIARQKRRTPSEIISDVRKAARSKGGRCVTSTYRSIQTRWQFECCRGHRFSIQAAALLNEGRWCSQCRKEDFVAKVQKAAQKSGGICVNKRWKSTAEQWTFQCSSGHKIRKHPHQVLDKGLRCRRCHQQSLYDEVRLKAEASGGRVVTKSYRKFREHWQFECRNGHRLQRLGLTVLHSGLSCEKCISQDVFQRICAKAESLNGKCLSPEGLSTNDHWKFRCENGHEFELQGGHLLHQDIWCQACKHDSVLHAVHTAATDNGGRCLTIAYRPTADDWSFRCENGHRFERSASSVLYQGAWCPKCLRRSPADMLNKLRHVAQERGGKCLSERYLKRPEKMKFQCRHGHRWDALGSLVLYGNSWCPTCADLPSEDFIKRFEDRLDSLDGRMVRSQLGRLSNPHQFICAKGHRFMQKPTKILSAGHWCPTCSYEDRAEMQRLGIEAAITKAAEKGGECLEEEYLNANQKAWWRCEEGHEWQAAFKSVIYGGTWCPECWDIRRRQPREEPPAAPRKLGIEDCHALADRHGGLCLTGYYINYMHEMVWRCSRKHEWLASLHAMEARESFCVECADIDRRQEWLQKAHEFAGSHGGRCLSKEWISAQMKLKWKCSNGHRFETCWNNVIVPPFCGQCAKEASYQARGVERLQAIAEKHGGRWIEATYTGARDRYEFECQNGCRFKATPKSADNSWARYCQCKATSEAS